VTGSLLYLVIFALACAPGLPLGWRLFGRSPAGWIAGALIGYALTAFAIWTVIALHAASAAAFLVAWLALSILTWLGFHRMAPALAPLPRWTATEGRALALVLVLTSIVAIPPLANVGAADGDGNRYYRAYFTADFVWHMALTAEVAKFSMPPRNPFLAHRPIHYYWTYYLLPAAVSATGPTPVRSVQRCLAVNAFATGLLLMAAVFVAAFAAVGRGWPAAAGAALALIASSAEGIATLAGIWYRGLPLAAARDVNIDAMSAWVLGAHRIDGLQRCLWYVPQHSMAYALGLIALAAGTATGSTGSIGLVLLAGIALAGSVAMNPFVGGIFALAYGAAVAVDALRRPAPLARIALHALAGIPVVLVLLWCVSNQMVEGAGGALQVGFSGASRHWPVASLLLSLGPILMAGGAGLWPSPTAPLARVMPFAVLALVSLFLLYFVQLSVDDSWVGFRAGQMMLVALAVLAARFLAVGWSVRPAVVAAVVGGVLLTGVPTTIIDEYNARDVHNRSMSPGGFPWTIVVTVPQQHALDWIRTNTAPHAIVQMDPTVRERSTWSLIPSFAERRMAAGLPISLLNVPEYTERSESVRTMYDTPSAAQAADIARRMRIDYIYVDAVERTAHPAAAKFDASPEYFERVFDEADVGLYRVK
jgi:hypothetical protein